MIILRAGIRSGHLLLWGEESTETAAPAKSRGRPATKARRVSPLPYAAGVDALSAALPAAALDSAVNQASAEKAVIWLPTVEGRPLASSPMIAESPGSNGHATISPWEVTTLSLPTARVTELLCYCAGRETLARGIVIGADLAFCAQAVRFAGSIVARQSYLPSVDLKGPAPRTRWEPVFAGADTQRLKRLAAAMLHACRALTGREEQSPPDTPAVTVLSDFITEIVGELVRSAFTPDSRSSINASRRRQARSFESVHDQWLHALRADDGAMTGEVTELVRLAEQVREWQRPVAAQAATPFRLCFRLEEPAADGEMSGGVATTSASTSQGRWQVSYLLQAVDDPSLIVPAAQVWNARGRQAALLNRGEFRPREYLLSALGQAAKVSSQVERSLRAAAPGGYKLDAMGAHEFLREQAWLLEQSGFGVMLPAWWTRKGTKLKLTARAVVESPKFQGGGRLSLEEIVKFDWEIALGDERLSLAELETLVRLKSPLVKVRGQWVELNAEEIQAALNFWKKGASGRARVRDLVQMALGGNAAVPGGWKRGRGTTKRPSPKASTERSGLIRYAATHGSASCEVGVWARVWQMIWGFHKLSPSSKATGGQTASGRRWWSAPCPSSATGRRRPRFTPDLPVMVHHGLTRAKGKAFKREAERSALVLSSYALLHRDFEFLKEVEWSGVVLDEAQNIKNAQTKQAQAARALPAGYRAALTGTPVENNVGDLWSLMEFLNPGFLGTLAQFKRNFFLPIQANGDEERHA